MGIDVEGFGAHDTNQEQRKEVLPRGRPVHIKPLFGRQQQTQPLTQETHGVESEAFLGGERRDKNESISRHDKLADETMPYLNLRWLECAIITSALFLLYCLFDSGLHTRRLPTNHPPGQN